MWGMIFGGTLILGIIGVLFLVTRFSKFGFVRRLSKGKNGMAYLLGLCMTGVVFLVSFLCFGIVNAIIVILYLMLFFILSGGIVFVIRKIRKKDFKVYMTGILAIVLTITYLSIGFYAAHHVWRTAYAFTTDKTTESLRIVMFSDSHVGTTFDSEGFSELVDCMNAERPDVVLVAGDFVDDDTTKEDMIGSCEAMAKFSSTYGTYFVFGNHDKGYYGDSVRGFGARELREHLAANGVVILEDECCDLGSGFTVIGRKDRSEEDRSNGRLSMQELMETTDRDRYSIVMDHQPNDYANEAAAGPDLLLSGHTHGGQLIAAYIVGTLMKANDLIYGHEKREATDFIVSSGISDWAIKFKTGCYSEYVVIDINR